MKRAMWFVGMRALMTVALIAATYYGANGAKNVLVAYVWFCACGALYNMRDEGVERLRKLGDSPAWMKAVGRFHNLLLLVALVWFGWWVTAFGLLLFWLANEVCVQKAFNPQPKEQA